MVFCLLLCFVIVPFRSNSCLLSQVLPAIKIVAKDGVYNSSLLTALVGKYAINSSLGGDSKGSTTLSQGISYIYTQSWASMGLGLPGLDFFLPKTSPPGIRAVVRKDRPSRVREGQV